MHVLSVGKWSDEQALVNNLGRKFHKLRKKVHINYCLLHDLRRSCITNWAYILPIHVVQKLAGHSDIKTTQKYYLVVRQEDMEKGRILQSKILANDLTDPLFAKTGLKQMGRGGFEPPTHGFSVRCGKNVTADKTKTCKNPKEQLTPQLTPKSPKQPKIDTEKLPPDLAKIVQVWPELPEHIKAAIKALVQTHNMENK